MTLNGLSISYPDFKLNDIIDPEQFDINNGEIVTRINEIKDVVNKITDSVTGGGSGADQISLTAIAPFVSTKLQAFLAEVITRLKSVTPGTSGSEFIGSSAIIGVTGATVFSQLGSLKTLLDGLQTQITNDAAAFTTHKTSADHDGRYYTETETDAKLVLKADSSTLYTRAQLDAGQLDTRYYTEAELVNGALDGRYYTEAEVVSIADANKNGDHVGTWRGLTPSQVSEAINGARLDVIEGVQPSPAPSALNLNSGLQAVNMPRTVPYNVLSVKGRTLTNLNGRKGNFEDSALPSVVGGTAALDTTKFTSGKQSWKFTLNTTSGQASRSVFDSYIPAAGDYFVALIDVFLESATSATILLGSSGTTPTYTSTPIVSGTSTDIGKWKTLARKINVTANAAGGGIMIAGAQFGGASGNVAYLDSSRLFKITQAEYNALDSMTPAQVAATYPYVDDMKPITNPYAIAYGENLLPPFTEWTLHANAVVNEPYKMTLTATATNQFSIIDIPALPSTNYRMDIPYAIDTNYRLQIFSVDENNVETNLTVLHSLFLVQTFITLTTTRKLRVKAFGFVSGTYVFEKPILSINISAKSFKPRKDQMIVLPTQFASNVDGSVADQLHRRGSEYWVDRHFRDVILDGSLAWTFSIDGAGFKEARVPISGQVANSGRAVKYDGKILTVSLGGASSGDVFVLASDTLYLEVADTDSGWPETYTPTAAEIQAYFYGWKMITIGSPYASPWDGVGTKGWSTMKDHASSVTTVPTAESVVTNTYGWTPYKLQYQLTTPVQEQIIPEGEITLPEGLNQVETGVGMIVRERANPILSGTYNINNWSTSMEADRTKYRIKKFWQIYKGTITDSWGYADVTTNGGYGGILAQKNAADYDPSSAYTVTYLALDQYLLSCPFASIQGEYDTHVKSDVDRLMRRQADVATRVSVLETQKVGRVQPQWTVPTLLNGWVNYDTINLPGYRLNSSQNSVSMKGLIKNGVITPNTLICILPYKPKEDKSVILASYSPWVFTTALLNVRGELFIQGADVHNAALYLDNVNFTLD